MAYMFEEDGLPPDTAAQMARAWPSIPVLLKTMVEKELGLTHGWRRAARCRAR